MKIIRLLFIAIFAFQASFGQSWKDTVSLIDKALSQYLPQDPGAQLSVSRNGQVIFSKAWGMADLERNVPLSTHSIIEAGSVSKQFVAASVLLLEQQGKLSLDDDVRKYVPEIPDYGTPIKLRQMLHHTSGLRDWGAIADFTGWPRTRKFYTNDDALEIIIRQKHLNNKPGDEFLYSNSNYNLFAIIVQRVSGLTLAAFTKRYIFEPAGMEQTQWRDDPNRIVPNRAIAYENTINGFETNMPNEYVYGNGGLLTTTEDLLKWNNYYLSGRLGSPSLLPKQILTEPLNNGVMNIYAAGLFINKVRGWNVINHSGATAGYRAFVENFPELKLSYAILSNNGKVNVFEIAGKLRRIFVPYKTEKPTEHPGGVMLSDAYLNGFAGLYLNERDHSTFELSLKDGHLMLDNALPLVATSKNTFTCEHFHLKIEGSKGFYIPLSPVDSMPFTKVKPADLSTENLNRYAGKYFSEETNSTLTVQPDSGKLIVHLNAHIAYQLIPTYTDAFKIPEIGADLEFTKNPQNNIIGIKMSDARAREVEFNLRPVPTTN